MNQKLLNQVQPEQVEVELVRAIEAGLSNYYLADEVQGTYRGMMIAIPPYSWVIFSEMTVAQLSELLLQLAGQVRLSSFRSHPREPKKPLPERTRSKNQTHVSTAKLRCPLLRNEIRHLERAGLTGYNL